MEYIIESFRHGELILEQTPAYNKTWSELKGIINNITDNEIIQAHEAIDRNPMSISQAINSILREQFISKGWNEESHIFQEAPYVDNSTRRWRLDFAKESISVEVAFNHSGVIPWNLVKPVLAGELNHVKKAIDTKVGVVICATNELKQRGGFDNAIGEFEKFLIHLNPLRDILTIPMVIVGLEPPKTFEIIVEAIDGKNQAVINRY